MTDVVKSADIVGEWRRLPRPLRETIAKWWAPVLAYELEHGQP
jgi:hypothetical protein